MSNYNFNNKVFLLVQNTDNGKVNSETVFKYKQDGNLVTADFSGGSVRYGKIIAFYEGDKLNMIYQMITIENDLKSGQAVAKISMTEAGKIKLNLNWQWLTTSNEKGQSEYIEAN